MQSKRVSYRPELMLLESRLQPGSMLNTNIESSLLAGGLVPFDLQDKNQETLAGMMVSSLGYAEAPLPGPGQQVANADNLRLPGQGLVSQPTSVNLPSNPSDGVYALQPYRLQNLDLLPVSLQSNRLRKVDSAASHGPGPGPGLCEDPGNIVRDGDFETIPPPDVWFQIDDPYADIVEGGGDLTPGHHLVFGAVGTLGDVYQDLTTQAGQMYNIRFSVRLGPVFRDSMGMPDRSTFALTIMWGNDEIQDIGRDADTSAVYPPRAPALTVQGHGADRLTFREQQDLDYWHVDDVCVTPVV